MKTVIPALVAFVVLGSLATSSIGCSASSSSSSKSDVDTGSALSQLQNPTGSFSQENAGTAFGNYRSKRADSAQVTAPGASSGTSNTASIRLLDKATASGSSCQQGEACACPNGGSLTYSGSNTADGQLVKVSFDSCGFEDGFGFDGKAALLLSNKSLLGLADSSSSAAATPPRAPAGSADNTGGVQDAPSAAPDTGSATSSAVAVLLAAKGTASYGAKKLALEFALVTESHYAFLAVKVSDGAIVIGVSDSGEAIVKSREGTWKCHSGTGGWSCTSDSGKTMTVAEQAPTDPTLSDNGPAAPSAPPSSASDGGSSANPPGF